MKRGLDEKLYVKMLNECCEDDIYIKEIMRVSNDIIVNRRLGYLYDILRSYDRVVKWISNDRIGDVSFCKDEEPFWRYGHEIVLPDDVDEFIRKMDGLK